MSTSLLEDVATGASHSPAQHLRTTTAAVRLSFTWFGTRKTLSPEQKDQAAFSFGARGDFLSAGKKLLDTRHPSFKAVSAVRSRAVSYWKGITLPYPEAGIRLIRQDRLEPFDDQMRRFEQELGEAVSALDERYHELKASARDRLGELYNAADYPDSLRGLFEMTWEFPSVEPPDYLMQLNPELYEQECRRVAARFDDAVQLAEQAFVGELSRLVAHLTERLTGESDGKPKVFRNSAVENLTAFFAKFQRLNIRSNEQLDELVEHAQQIVQGVQPQSLREDHVLRQTFASELSTVQNALDELLVDRPRRNILRRPR